MTTILTRVESLLESGDSDGAREEIARSLGSLAHVSEVDSTVRYFAALLALGSQNALEIGLGVLGRTLLQVDGEVEQEVIWLLLSAVLSRSNIPADSPSRISFLGLVARIKDWKSPIFALFAPRLDSFFKVSLSESSSLIAEQTLDFIATWGENYAKAPHVKPQLKKLQSLSQTLLDSVDDIEVRNEWEWGINTFCENASQVQYNDSNIWSASGDLLKKIYPDQILSRDGESGELARTKYFIQRLITSCLASIEPIFANSGLSVALRIDNPDNPWSVVDNTINNFERLFQEIADAFNIIKTPVFTPVRAIPGSWTVILHVDLSSDQSNLLIQKIAEISARDNQSIFTRKDDEKSELINSWHDCVARLKEEDIRVDLAVSNNSSEWNITKAISTEDEDISTFEVSDQPRIRLLSNDIPQANDLEKVIYFASLLMQHSSSILTVRRIFLETTKLTPRQFSYYRRSAQILGLADERERPTNACYTLDRLPESSKTKFLAYQFISSNVGLAWLKWQNARELSELEPKRTTEFLLAVCPSLSETTANRRARTLQSWLKIFRGFSI